MTLKHWAGPCLLLQAEKRKQQKGKVILDEKHARKINSN